MRDTVFYRMKGIFKHMKEFAGYLIPSCVTLVIYCIILSVKEIYPFGSNTIDYYDMAQQIAAFYYHVYDMLHGTKAYFYDWYSALGTNMAMSTSGCSNLSPFNLFFLLINRSSLLKSLSVFNGLKLMCMSLSMYFYLNKTHEKTPFFFKLAASVGYSFCGFVLVLYITNQWVDIAAMFPLIMYFYDRLIETGRIRGYVITLTITLIASYYLGFMILIFIFLYTGLKLAENLYESMPGRKGSAWRGGLGYIFTGANRTEESKGEKSEDGPEQSYETGSAGDASAMDTAESGGTESESRDGTGIRSELHLTRLGIGTFMSLALSAWILIPQIAQMLHSARFKNGNEGEASGLFGRYLEIISHVRGDYTTRWWSLLGISFAAAIILTGMVKFRKDRKAIFTTISLIAMMVLELFFESINLIWHFGSYVQYPIRNGFIIYFVFAYLSCYYAARLYGEEEASGKSYLSFIITVIGFLAFIGFYRNHTGMPLRRVFHITSGMMAAGFVYYMVILNRQGLLNMLSKAGEGLFRRKQGRTEDAEEPVQEGGSKYGNKRINNSLNDYRWAAGVLVLELLCYGFLLFGKPDFITGYSEEPEQNGQYIYLCEQLKDKFGLENEFLYRVKNPDESLNANYGFVLMQPALSNWTHMIAPGEQEGAAAWGYSIQFTRLLDAGGTVFSDALIGVRKIISRVPMDEKLYTEINRAEINVDPVTDETVTYYLYEPVYKLPFGEVIRNETISDGEEDPTRKSLGKKSSKKLYAAADDQAVGQAVNEQDTVKLHNMIYHSIVRAREDTGADTGTASFDQYKTAGESDMAVWYLRDNKPVSDNTEAYVDISASDKIVSSKIRVSGEMALYVSGSGGDLEYANCTIEEGNGDDMHMITVPTIGDYANIYYPAHFNNNSVYIGCYKDETVEVRVTMDGDKGDYFDVDIMGVSVDAMKTLCAGDRTADDAGVKADGSGLTLNRPVSRGAQEAHDYVNRLLLPVTFDKGFGISVNGKKVKGSSYAGLFTVIPLEDGDNTISMRFVPPGMTAGMVITLITAALILAYAIIMHTNKESLQELVTEPESRIEPLLVKLYACVFAAVILFMYIIPVVYGLFALVSGR